MNLTEAQAEAIGARGNVLVVAGAGTGKTRTVVRRCVEWLLEKPGQHSLEQVLMVTFTDAAAAEMRQRIREELKARLADGQHPDFLLEQLALLDTAFISTLHSFCFRLVRQHFYVLDLDPQLSILPAEEAQLLAEEKLTEILNRHYAGSTAQAVAVQRLIEVQASGWEVPIKRLVLRLHRYTQTLADPRGWLEEQLAQFNAPSPEHWRHWLTAALADWCRTWRPVLEQTGASNPNVARCLAALCDLVNGGEIEQFHPALDSIKAAFDADWPHGSVKTVRDPLKVFFEEAEFLRGLTGRAPLSEELRESLRAAGETDLANDSSDPLLQDWAWVRPQMVTLLELTREFGTEFAAAKRELGAVDFQDLEQFSLRLLWDPSKAGCTALARQWREKLHLIFVDEYQDINAAQDLILRALGREGAGANRFLVGDPKQSIYRFRLADPHIFHAYLQSWRQPVHGRVIPLTDNFRSHERILAGVNALFSSIMTLEVGGLAYDDSAQLRFGSPAERKALAAAPDPLRKTCPPVSLLVRVSGAREAEEEADSDGPENGSGLINAVSTAEGEARLIGRRLAELKREGFQLWDEEEGYRPVRWRDMVILLRSPQNKAEGFAKEFARLGIPLVTSRGGFFEAPEIRDLLAILNVLDNPLQDIPLLAVLRSPLAGLSLDELALVRLAGRGHFWNALQQFHWTAELSGSGRVTEKPPRLSKVLEDPALGQTAKSAWEKADRFLRRYSEWRRLARQTSLSQCLDQVLTQTGYLTWAVAQARGPQARGNLSKLLTWARQFDQFQRQGLFRFLRFVTAQQEAEIDRAPAPVDTSDAVRLLSIHQSKGLEFGIVVVADLGKPFNLADLKGDLILDEQYGLCPMVKPPFSEQGYPSLPYWLAQRRQQRETLSEEMRLLYVAMTRACQALILAGTVSQTAARRWSEARPGTSRERLLARSYLDWIGPWLAQTNPGVDWTQPGAGGSDLLHWTIYAEAAPASGDSENNESELEQVDAASHLAPEVLAELAGRLAWTYPHPLAVDQPAKTSVSMVRQAVAALAENGSAGRRRRERGEGRKETGPLSAAEIGEAHHLFLQFVSLDRVQTVAALQAEADRLTREGLLSPVERAALDLKAIAAFWGSRVGGKILARREALHREVPFTAKLSLAELLEFQANGQAAPPPAVAAETEFIVLTGVVDLVVLLPEEIWILDFKTDAVKASEWKHKAKSYEPQVQLYARALERIYRRRVTHCWLHSLVLHDTVQLERVISLQSL